MKTRFDLTLKHRWLGTIISFPLDIQISDVARGLTEIPSAVDSNLHQELIEAIRKGLLFGTENWRVHHLRILDLPSPVAASPIRPVADSEDPK